MKKYGMLQNSVLSLFYIFMNNIKRTNSSVPNKFWTLDYQLNIQPIGL